MPQRKAGHQCFKIKTTLVASYSQASVSILAREMKASFMEEKTGRETSTHAMTKRAKKEKKGKKNEEREGKGRGWREGNW